MRKTLSVDLRERVLRAYDRGDSSREQVAARFAVSLGMVKKLIQQRRHTGDIAPRHRRAGRKPGVAARAQRRLRALVAKKPDLTLREMRESLALDCTLPAIHYVLAKLGLTYKKRRSAPPNRIGPTSSGRGASGVVVKAASIPRA
jgi:transposase